MPLHCINCGKKGTMSGSRSVNTNTHKCNECQPGQEEIADPPNINPDSMLGELSVRDFKTWFKNEIDDMVQNKVDRATAGIKTDIDTVKTSAKTANDEVTKLKNTVQTLTKSLEDLTKETEQWKKTGENNLKYLVNHDRNQRRCNVMVLGLEEGVDLTINDETSTTDEDKINSLLQFIGVGAGSVEICSLFRCGKTGGEGIRPVKVILKNGDMAQRIISKAPQLKTLNKKIFIKSDKSKKEREEFQRLLKKKEQCLVSHPAVEGETNTRVVLEKGVLRVDNVEVDRYKSPQTLF